jgi:hypothetical protein
MSPSVHEGSALALGSMRLTISNLPSLIRLNWMSRDAAPSPYAAALPCRQFRLFRHPKAIHVRPDFSCAPYAETGRAWCLWARMELLDGALP